MPASLQRRYASPTEAAVILGTHPATIRRLIAQGTLPATRLGHRTVRIALVDLDALIESRRIGGASS